MFAIHVGDSLELMSGFDEGSVDSVVTDPPYGLSFMGKCWDHGVPGVEFWVEALRVAKPGAHLLAFGGTRTFHRLVCAIEDAGWEIRDTIMWVYGCLSEDTEVLTRDGWELYHKAIKKEIMAYDVQGDFYQWETPQRWSTYRVESDTAYRIASDTTDQIVSRNHRCLIERSGGLEFVAAEQLSGLERMPTLPSDFSEIQKSGSEVLQPGMQRILPRAGMEEVGKGRIGIVEYETSPEGKQGCKKPSMEGRSHVLQAEGQVREPVHQVCAESAGVHSDGAQGWLCDGASPTGGSGTWEAAIAERVRTSHQPRRDRQQAGKPDAVCVELGPQTVRTRTTYQSSLATVTEICYSGVIFCPTVSTGAFVARRNGKVFITGNSGFPKSLDVSKAIDKASGAERAVVGVSVRGSGAQPHKLNAHGPGDTGIGYMDGSGKEFNITAPSTESAKQWDGWGTALKPSWEPIIVARKPLRGTVARNVQEHGTGGLNIDGCRVPTNPDVDDPRLGGRGDWASDKMAKNVYEGGYAGERVGSSPLGRWPANLIHDGSDDVLELFPSQKSGANPTRRGSPKFRNSYGVFEGHESCEAARGAESGSAARFFYSAKASRSDRTMDGQVDNKHPTVKPNSLMRYLCRLVTPTNGTVFDPFCGSGSTGVAAVQEGFKFLGIDKDEESVATARERVRIAAESGSLPLFDDGK